MNNEEKFMQAAIQLSQDGAQSNVGGPFGCVIVKGTKIIFTGDVFQIDTPYLDSHSNGLSNIIEKLKDNHLYAHINLEKGERSELANLAGTML